MRESIVRTCAVLALALLGLQTVALAENRNSVRGTWDVNVTVTNCQTGAVIRTVRSLQMFSRDGSFTETANTASRGSSLGRWARSGENTFGATYWFFRYTSTGTFASIAKSLDSITLSEDGSFRDRPDVAIVVFGENAYAEGKGDIATLEYQPGDKRDLRLLQRLQSEGIPVVAVFLSGRPLYVTPEINASNAFIAAARSKSSW